MCGAQTPDVVLIDYMLPQPYFFQMHLYSIDKHILAVAMVELQPLKCFYS